MKIYAGLLIGLASGHYALTCTTLPTPSLHHLVTPLAVIGGSLGLLWLLFSTPPERPAQIGSVHDEPHCKLCLRVRRENAHHCSICGVCIQGFDHHCDVIDVCIGAGNISIFRGFLLYHTLAIAYAAYVHVSFMPRGVLFATAPGVYVLVEINLLLTLVLFTLFHMCLWASGIRTIDVCRHMTRTLKRAKQLYAARARRSV